MKTTKAVMKTTKEVMKMRSEKKLRTVQDWNS